MQHALSCRPQYLVSYCTSADNKTIRDLGSTGLILHSVILLNICHANVGFQSFSKIKVHSLFHILRSNRRRVLENYCLAWYIMYTFADISQPTVIPRLQFSVQLCEEHPCVRYQRSSDTMRRRHVHRVYLEPCNIHDKAVACAEMCGNSRLRSPLARKVQLNKG